MKFKTETSKPGVLVPLDQEAVECCERMNQPLTESARKMKEVGNSLDEAHRIQDTEIPGLVKVKVDVPLPCQRRQEDAYVAMGFSRREAQIAAGTDSGKQGE